jgi:hypothetical protein
MDITEREHPLLRSAMRGEAISKKGKAGFNLTTEEAGLYSRTTRQETSQRVKYKGQRKRAHLSDIIRLQMDHTAGSSSSIRT